MEHIGIRDLRQSIAATVRRAGAGRTVVITVDGHPVAQLGPLQPTESARSLHAMADRGEIVLARDPRRVEPPDTVALWPGARIDRLIREVRGR